MSTAIVNSIRCKNSTTFLSLSEYSIATDIFFEVLRIVGCSFHKMDVDIMTFQTGLRGYHVYKQIWRPCVPQFLEFSQERDNDHDEFAVAGYARFAWHTEEVRRGTHTTRIFQTYLVCPEYGATVTGKVIS